MDINLKQEKRISSIVQDEIYDIESNLLKIYDNTVNLWDNVMLDYIQDSDDILNNMTIFDKQKFIKYMLENNTMYLYLSYRLRTLKSQ